MSGGGETNGIGTGESSLDGGGRAVRYVSACRRAVDARAVMVFEVVVVVVSGAPGWSILMLDGRDDAGDDAVGGAGLSSCSPASLDDGGDALAFAFAVCDVDRRSVELTNSSIANGSAWYRRSFVAI